VIETNVAALQVGEPALGGYRKTTMLDSIHRGRCVLLGGAALLLAGCPGTSTAPPTGQPVAEKPVTVVVVDDPSLVQAVVREWRGRSDRELKVQEITAAQAEQAGRLPGDVVVFPTGMVGHLVERGLILPLEDGALEDPDYGYRDVFAPLRLTEMRWGNRTVGVTLGSPRLLLAYRTDIFARLQMKPPADWTEYQQAAERLADRSQLGDLAPAEGQPWCAAVEPLAEGWAGQLLLARAAAYALHRDQVSPLFKFDTAEPLIAEPPYRRALEELIAAHKAAGLGDKQWTPEEALRELREGRAAMALCWPAPAKSATEVIAGPDSLPIGFALLPGSPVAYNFATKTWDRRGEGDPSFVPLSAVAGRMGAVTSSSADPRGATEVLVFLGGLEAGGTIAAHSPATTLFRPSQVASPARWAGGLNADSARQYAEAIAQAMELPRAFPGLRLPGRTEYLAALDQAVQQAILGKKTAAEALSEAAEAWREITKKLGQEAQQRANARSLGQQSL
jgi:ABC-type glycerol-3-phosphate transport system substrate-binding protein